MSKEEKDKKLNEFYKTKAGEKLKNQYNIALGILFIVAGLCCMTLIIEESLAASNSMLDLIDMCMLIVIIGTVGYAGYTYGSVMGAFNYYLSVEPRKEEKIMQPKEVKATKKVQPTQTKTNKTTKATTTKKKKTTKTKAE